MTAVSDNYYYWISFY